MNTINKIEYDELNKKINRINDLTIIVKDIFSKMDEIIMDNVASGKGIWDGNDASNYKSEWCNLRDDIPKVVDIFRKQAKNIENNINQTSSE